jgi:hypothetical protein
MNGFVSYLVRAAKRLRWRNYCGRDERQARVDSEDGRRMGGFWLIPGYGDIV